LASIKVTVMVENAVPSAITLLLGDTDTVEANALGAAAMKVICACCVMLVAPTLAPIVLVSASDDLI